MAARAYSGKKPKNLKHTLRVFLSYLGRHKKMLAVVAVLVTISAGANLLGTYMIRPVVNGLADGDVHTLLHGVLITALIFGCGALAAYGYTQTMVKAAQQVVYDIRRDLFEHVQTLPLQFFDSRRHGDIMSLFTNDIDTMLAERYNGSLRDLVRNERRVELAQEGLRFADIRRWGILLDVMNKPIEGIEYRGFSSGTPKHTVLVPAIREAYTTRDFWWPIPQAEIDLNPDRITQNEGWK